MAGSDCETLDPRIRRTRLLLQQALEKLLETKEFDKISVQDIADASTLNRATFYDHYADKFALLDGMVALRFDELLTRRGVCFDETCGNALKNISLAVCDFLAGLPGLACGHQRQMEPHLESAVIAVVRRMILEGLNRHPSDSGISPEFTAAAVSWSIYGTAMEWVRSPSRCSPDEIADTIVRLASPIFTPSPARSEA